MKRSKTEIKGLINSSWSWGELNYDLLHKILILLPAKDLLRSVSLVCRHWRSATGIVLFWKDGETLDLTPLNVFFDEKNSDAEPDDQRLFQALKSVLNWKMIQYRKRIKYVTFAPNSMHIKHIHIALLAQRSPMLKKLMLPNSYDIDVKELTRIIKRWKQLEELSIGPLDHGYTDRLFKTMGIHCKNLTKLHMFGSFNIIKTKNHRDLDQSSFRLDETIAGIMAENLKQLRVLSLDEAYLCKSGVWTLLSESDNLVELNLKHCIGYVDPPKSFMLCFVMIKRLEDKISVEIKRVEKNCSMKIWSLDNDRITTFRTEEVLDRIWTDNVIEVKRPDLY